MPADDTSKRVPVSVIIPCYNCSKTIALAVDSVIRQSALPEEIFLVDDASSDNGQTTKALHAIKERLDRTIKVNIIHLDENKGPAFARNTGWNVASQPYIALLDADDAWHPKKLEITYDIMERNPLIDLIGHDFYISGRTEMMKAVLSESSYEIVKKGFYSILFVSPFVTPSFFLKRSIAERFNVHLRYCEDYEFLLRVAHRYHVYYTTLKLVQLGKEPFTGGGLTAKRTSMRMGEIKMYLEALKYRKGLVVLLPVLILFSMIKHVTLLGLSFLRGKSI
jgi:teichuronic acid biosynthesis glycosyltransferase TuaG